MLDHSTLSETPRRPFRLARRPDERTFVLGSVMDFVKAAEVLHFAKGRIVQRKKAIVANHNLHSLYLLRRDQELKKFYDLADLVEVDSIPLIAWAGFIGRSSRRFHRCTYLDWRDELWNWVEREGLRVFFVGGEPGVAERAIARIHARWPGAVVGSHHGFFDMQPDSRENRAVVDRVTEFAPDILLVGMGMPRQEAWVYRNYSRLPDCVIFTVGAAFDYEAGAQLACPRWIGQLGAEWLFRLLTNPRLFSRYVIEPWSLIAPAIRDLVRRREAKRTSVRASGFVGSRR